MSFHRFEDFATPAFAPLISTSRNHMIESKYLYYNWNNKPLGTGSEPHYHPNELLIFVMSGKVNALIGKERQVLTPGMLGMVPPNGRHSFKACENEDCIYLYHKDNSWGLVGVREDEVAPEESMTVKDAHELKSAGKEGRFYKQDKEASGVVIEGMRPTFYKILESFDDPIGYANRRQWYGGERLDFGFFELPEPYEESQAKSDTDQFMYVIQGTIKADVNNEKKSVKRGDVIQINVGEPYTLSSDGSDPVRLARVRPTPAAIKLIDSQPPQKT